MNALARLIDTGFALPDDRLPREPERSHGAPHPAEAPKLRSDRRGPFRPDTLASARNRISGAALARIVRGCDIAAMAVMAWLSLSLTQADGPLGAPLGLVLAYAVAGGLVAWALKAADAYRFGPGEPLMLHIVRTAGGFVIAALLGSVLLSLVKPAGELIAGLALWWATSFALAWLAHLGWWLSVRKWRKAGLLTPNVVVVGATAKAEKLIQTLLETREAAVLGVFDDRLGRAPDAICGVPVLGDTQAMLSHRIMPYVDRVVITVPSTAQARVRQLIERLHVLPNDISLVLEFDAARGSSRALSRLAQSPLAQVSGRAHDEARASWKRVQDLVIGSVILVAAVPLMAAVALAVKLDSPGPVLFRQRRHGFNNEEIVVWKFRSMRTECADCSASRQVSHDDDRVTRVGRFIRRTSLDELPQILNVLKGEMSLVGPRPHAIGMKTGETESARLVAEYAHRHRIKPGITGWAAIKGSRGPVNTPADVRRRVALDVDYIERQSLWLDLYILLMTLPCLLGDRAAVR
jgi:Undecaprenyl-phosphate glucose phosphotransferase